MQTENGGVRLSFIEQVIRSRIQHFDYKTYFRWYKRVTGYKKEKGFLEKIICTWLLYRIKKCDAFNNATLGAHLGCGVEFKGDINLPHGIRGITLTHGVRFGNNCTMYHYVSVTGDGMGGTDVPYIGDNVFIGVGAHLIGGIKIGNSVKIGAGCTVTHDVPDNTTVVSREPRFITRD